MKQLLNTLYVTTQGAYLARDGEAVAVRVEQETKLRVPVHTLSNVVCFGQVSCSPFLMGLCGASGVALAFLTENGRFLARVHGPVSGNVLLRREQYRWADREERAAAVARSVVMAKVANCRTVALRALREKPGGEGVGELEQAARRLGRLLETVASAERLEEIRGHEGDAARVYFGIFDQLITASKEDFFFRGRNRRPPLDNMNALLSFVYTLLTHDVTAALEAVGLDPAVGYLHRDRPGRPSLGLDLVEELRPVVADRLALSLVNRRQVQGSGFRRTESGGVVMGDETRKEVLVLQPTTLTDPSSSVTLLQPATLQVRAVDDCGNAVTSASGAGAATFTNGDVQVKLAHIGNGNWQGTWTPRNGSKPQVGIQLNAFLEQGVSVVAGVANLAVTVRPASSTPVTFGAANAASGIGTYTYKIAVWSDRPLDKTTHADRNTLVWSSASSGEAVTSRFSWGSRAR